MTENQLFESISWADRNREELDALKLPETVVVASKSDIKVDTVRDTLKELFPDRQFKVVGVKTSSDVSDQPFNEVTDTGARNRLNNVQKEYLLTEPTDEAVFISIENGLFDEGKWIDKAVIYIILPNGSVYNSISAGVVFPSEAVEEARRLGTRTAGQIIAAENGGDHQNPQDILTNHAFPRQIQMLGALTEVFIKAAKAEALVRKHH